MIEYKNILADEVLDVDTERKTVKAVWANMANLDLDNDIINIGAFTKTINERGPGGKNLIWSLIDHNASLNSAIGKPNELYVEGTKLIAITKLVDNSIGEDVLALYNEGLINQHSIGFSIPKGRSEVKDNVRYINEVMLYEGSAVLWGANPETPTLGMFKNIAKPTPENASERLEKLCKLLKHGKLTDETFSLIEIEIKQIQSDIATYVAPDAPKPTNEKSLLDAIQLFNFLN